jgi:hypothetical protein
VIGQRHWIPAYAGMTREKTASAGLRRANSASPRRRPGPSVVLLLWALLLLLAAVPPARATVLVPLSLEELVATSEVIFTGTISEATTSVEGDLVYTTLRFNVEDLVVGELPIRVLELRFLGGTRGSQKTEVAGQYIPDVGTHGLFFVDDTVRDLVNPLSGWSQGHFPLIEVDGTVWLDLKNHPDYGLLQADTNPLAGKMRSLNFTREQIAERFPEQFRFPLSDFVAAISAIRAEQGK